MPFPDDENGDVLRRMEASGFDFSVPHDVEFFAVFRTEYEADVVARQFVADRTGGEPITAIETRPAENGGMELMVVKSMLVTHENVSSFEARLAERVSRHDGYMDGWGVLQE